MDGRICTICHEFKAWEKFYKASSQKNEHRCCCKECLKKTYSDPRIKRNQEKNRGKDPYDGTDKTCWMCKETFPRIKTWWTTSPSNFDGLNSSCLDCIAVLTIRSKAKKRGETFNFPNPFTGKEARALKAKQNHCCYICGKKENGKKLHLDHNHYTGRVRGYACNRCNTNMSMLDTFLNGNPEEKEKIRQAVYNPPAKYLYEEDTI